MQITTVLKLSVRIDVDPKSVVQTSAEIFELQPKIFIKI